MNLKRPKNIASELTACLPEALLQMLERAGEFSAGRGDSLYIVGGLVRDILLGLPGKDMDLVVEGDSLSLARELEGYFNGHVTLHERFRTARFEVKGFTIDIAAARREHYEHPGALPVVETGTLKDDLKRRDFSINSIAVAASGKDYGDLIDPLGGLADINAGIIRVLHPASFKDDPTRILRAIRYEQRFGFRIEPVTLALLAEDKKLLPALSSDRLRYEFECIFAEEKPEDILIRAGELSILAEVFPGLLFGETSATWFKNARGVDPARPVSAALYLALFFGNADDKTAKNSVEKLNLWLGAARAILDVHILKTHAAELKKTVLKPSELCRLLSSLHPLALEAGRIIFTEQVIKRRLSLYLSDLCHIKPELSGDDLIKLGYRPGKKLGQALEKIKDAKLDGTINSREGEISLAKELLREQ